MHTSSLQHVIYLRETPHSWCCQVWCIDVCALASSCCNGDALIDAPGFAESATADVVVRLRANPGAVSPAELRVAIIGNVDSGKSTMVSTLALSSLQSALQLLAGMGHARESQAGRPFCCQAIANKLPVCVAPYVVRHDAVSVIAALLSISSLG